VRVPAKPEAYPRIEPPERIQAHAKRIRTDANAMPNTRL